ncbi:Selenide, water dikinase 1 [Seminavis robusta]|uniref:Selenide, water dikinase 1 n=1 Tax=Seminavis robusta TaxID=568900 RepID=A0A9N8EU01_9STRA|nr:Selenide, water dikinase 1 [Seminavis robusta]|eukprot:Sro1872_g302800.1 Selenide, water dikinase 1 (338) ;mRNA; f:10321-11334
MLAQLNLGDGQNLGTADGRIALDCSVRKTRQGHYVISTTDFFFPLVDSPYLQGRIGAANVLSDLYAEGVESCDFVLMLLAACRDMPEDQRTICTKEMVRGFRDACTDADTCITGGQTVLNPWPIIGGVATSVVAEGEFVPSDGAQVGNVVVLTKPLGTQIAVNVHQWRRHHQNQNNNNNNNKFWKKCTDENIVTDDQAEEMMHQAVCSMARLNKNAGSIMVKHKACAATDVTGFGILGHAQNLVENQKEKVGIELHTLPLIAGTKQVNDKVLNFQLTTGYSAETSGGLMICMPKETAQAYMEELKDLDGTDSWIIGTVIADEKQQARILEDVKYLEV